jgi:hypothetical protein
MDQTPAAGNPYNDRPSVRLLDQEGRELDRLSQREAGRLLRTGQADLVLEVPPAVRLVIPIADYLALRAGQAPGDAGKARFLHARQGRLYGNVHFQNPAGEMMFHGDSEKALWYLNRALVEVVSQEPPVLRFTFTPGGPGHAGDEYYLTGKRNQCVVCGASEGLNKHHVVPSVYRRHMPREVKDHSHHDVLLLCLDCHEKYEAEANRLKAELGEEHGIPLHGLRGEGDRERARAVKLASALVRHGQQIPPARKEEMLRLIGAQVGRVVPEADVEEIARLGIDDAEAIEHGQHVIAATKDVEGFIRRWREHFVRTMQPRFLPEHWELDKPVARRRASPPEQDQGFPPTQ